MAYGIKTGGRNFAKGNSLGKGQPKLSEEQLNIKRTIQKLNGRLLVAKYAIMSFDELLIKMTDTKIPVIDLMIMKILERCISKAELPILIWVYTILGWNSELTDEEKKEVGQAKLIISLDQNKKASDLDVKLK